MSTRPSSKPRAETVPRLTLMKAEAAASLGVSVHTIERYMWPELRIIRFGRLQLVSVKELETWINRNGSRWNET